jgi:hypothetical protein
MNLVAKDFGDALWSVMFYLLVLLARPRMACVAAAGWALGIACAIEFLKLFHAPWLDALRANALSGFLLGHTFLWRDFVSYAIGVAAALTADMSLKRRVRRRREGEAPAEPSVAS